jgi:murein DD-endopeptidase MepM/ murein hydrolase activator NlpD
MPYCLPHLVFLVLLAILPLPQATAGSTPRLRELCNEFNALNTRIRDSQIDKLQAEAQFDRLIDEIREAYYASGGKNRPVSDWIFPLQGYDHRAIGGVAGSGYEERGYNYFDGNRHGGHPSQDIFIRDRGQQGVDDLTGLPVNVLSVTGGVVVAVEAEWQQPNSLRGGKYVWVYDPAAAALLYYAHNSDVLVAPGALLNPGDVIARVGRTGRNAFKSRSPTHLHMTCLSVATGLPAPRNIYRELVASKAR